MELLFTLFAFMLSALGIIGCIMPAIPGVIFSYVGLLCAWGAPYSELSYATIFVWLAISLAVTLSDYFLPALMTRRFGGSRAGAIGATAGAFAGIFFGPLGIIAGPFIGAVVGELLHDNSDAARALRVGAGSFFAFLVGTGFKLAACIAMLVVIVADTWGPFKEWAAGLF
ncbi:MAG: DUF456 domain-containing protein [Alistipes sp.]|nr:DUF456 domain-containing protein [Alistipes sp.]